MRTHTVLRAMGVVALLLAGSALVGCSSGDDDAADTPIGQALTEKFLENAGVTDEEEARCVAGGIVDSIGEARIEELGFTPDEVDMFEGADFTDDEIDTMVDIWFDCVDIRQLIATNLAADQGDEVERPRGRAPRLLQGEQLRCGPARRVGTGAPRRRR